MIERVRKYAIYSQAGLLEVTHDITLYLRRPPDSISEVVRAEFIRVVPLDIIPEILEGLQLVLDRGNKKDPLMVKLDGLLKRVNVTRQQHFR